MAIILREKRPCDAKALILGDESVDITLRNERFRQVKGAILGGKRGAFTISFRPQKKVTTEYQQVTTNAKIA